MKRFKVALQKGLEHLQEHLVNEGHEVCYDGECMIEPDVTIVSGIDSAYEGIENTQCMLNASGETGMLLIDATNLSPERVLHMIRNNHCGE